MSSLLFRVVVVRVTSELAIAAIAAGLAWIAPVSPQTSGEPRSLAITRVSVIDTKSGTVTTNMTVTVRGDRILNVEKGGAVPRDAEVVDGRGKFLIPGLWDMHVHLSYARSSALPVLVANGVTGVRDTGSDLAELDKWREQIAGNDIIGPTIVRAGPILNGKEFNRYQLAVTDELEARATVRTLQKVGVDFIKLHRRTSREAYFAIADESKRIGLPFVGHIPMTVSPAEASDAGQASIEHTETLFEGTFAEQNAGKDPAAAIAEWRATEANPFFARFVKNGTMVDPTLIAKEYLVRIGEAGQVDPRVRYIAATARKEASTVMTPNALKSLADSKPMLLELRAVTALMNRAGVPLLAGTDMSFIHPPGFSLHDELALLVESGISPLDALRAATVNPARLLRFQDSGVIAPKFRADLVLLDANPLEDIRNTQRIQAVFLRGKYLDRKSLDRLLEDAARQAEKN